MTTLTESTALEILRHHYSDARGWLVIPQAPAARRSSKASGVDALLMRLWRSRELRVYGVTYALRDTDWRRLVHDPQMAEGLAAYCHYGYVLAPAGVVSIEGLAKGWGWWEIDAQRSLLKRKQAILQPASKAVDMNFVTGLLQAVAHTRPTEDALVRANQVGFADGQAAMKTACERELRRLRALEQQVRAFEAASGIEIAKGCDPGRSGEALRSIMDQEVDALQLKQRLERTVQMVEGLAQDARRQLTALGTPHHG